MTDITDSPDLASDLAAAAMLIIKSNDPDIHGELQEAFAAALAPMEAENQRLSEVVEAARFSLDFMAAGDDDAAQMAKMALRLMDRAALRSTEASHDD